MPAREKDVFAYARAEFLFLLLVYGAALSARDRWSEQYRRCAASSPPEHGMEIDRR
jgi:hypothetical protein